MRLKICCAVLLILPAVAMACVDTRKGDYCAQYKDITQKSADHELDLMRVYNSRSPEAGWFGYGWSTSFEMRLEVQPDGSALVQDPLSRRIERYATQGGEGLRTGVAKIVTVASEKEGLGVEAASALRSRLLTSEEFRRAQVRQSGIPLSLPAGSKLRSALCAKALVTRIGDEYQRVTCGKGIDYFDLTGRLVRQEEDGYKLFIHYAGDRPDGIADSLGQKLDMKWSATGRIVEARTNKDASAVTYRYDEKDNLVRSSYADGSDRRFDYDANHKMIRVDDIDNSKTDVQYDGAGHIATMAGSDGSKVTYAYRYDAAYPLLHHWTVATTTDGSGKKTIREAEYFSTLDAAGVTRLVRVVKSDAQGTEEIALDENERIKHISKADGGFSAFSYHASLGKVIAMVTDEGRSDFGYDKAGNLIRASTGKGLMVRLGYDSHNRVIRMVESDQIKHERRELTFKYNAQNKPTEIRLLGKGAISVAYDSSGEITKVDSKQGMVMALEVTQAFQALLTLVRVTSANYCI